MSKAQQNLLMRVAGKLLYSARSIDDTMMHALNNLATAVNNRYSCHRQSNHLAYFLNYCASNQNVTKLYRASNMILTTDSDPAYLVAPKLEVEQAGSITSATKTNA